jgi:uncharacterized membrane-anchored protein YhcB (DUF1043 family)
MQIADAEWLFCLGILVGLFLGIIITYFPATYLIDNQYKIIRDLYDKILNIESQKGNGGQ